ncbi:hypothetical protein OH809_18805 [Streptomyces sp. NBC_00873]|uniref:hypothetical protein n=1 Tax=Streptomyces sp. NBC_00873 TaxID=2975852 RepID=UPI00386A3CF5|nr:hypothetical protein OH809_18805 [Streptomyces sp. NBC_00873]
MLWHAIAPSRRFTKASHDVVRHPRLNSDAKILLLYVQGLPDGCVDRPLSEHARTLGITGRAYQKAKKALVEHGFVHEWQQQNDRGRWVTVQLFANAPLTGEAAVGVRDGRDAEVAPPSVHKRAVGQPAGRVAGGYTPVDEELGKNTSHPPTEAEPEAAAELEPEAESAPEVAEGERVLLSLRHAHRELHLGAREARGLAEAAAEWLRRGVTAADLRQALTSGLPAEGVRSAVGFLRHRLVQKLPEAAPPPVEARPVPRAAELVVCKGPGDDHVFRPVGEETHCGPCRGADARQFWLAHEAAVAAQPPHVPWRERVAALVASPGEGGECLNGG